MGVPVQWWFFFLGGVFRDSGNKMFVSVLVKACWMFIDMIFWFVYYGVFFWMSSYFLFNTLWTQRVFISVEKYVGYDVMVKLVQCLFSVYWVDDVDVF